MNLEMGGASSFLLLVCLMVSSLAVMAKVQRVGGPAGWTVHGKDTKYPTWSTKIYHVNHDSLVFKYNKKTDSVLEVSKADYDACRTTHPIATYNTGDDHIPLTKIGDFYYICGVSMHCRLGQKVHAKVTQTGQ